jgi:mono/diheme cytochrome c family protein
LLLDYQVRVHYGIVLLAACAAEPPREVGSDATRYVEDRTFRRAAMVASLVNPANDYSQLRLAHYGVDGGWDDLVEWNPPVTARGSDEVATALDLGAAGLVDDPAALVALGEQAFNRYPVQLWGAAPPGLWSDIAHGEGGLVQVVLDQPYIAATCSTCHATVNRGTFVPGLANPTLDLGSGPGRIDVTTADGHEPVRIPDLRPVAWLTYLQADATVRQPDVIALAIRIETLIVTSHAEAIRPPRELALALATYVWSLAPAMVPDDDAVRTGRDLFVASCAGCHAGDGFTGEPVPLAVVGTDPTVGESRDRGTGNYRVPSLRGVIDRALLLHDASVHSLTELLDPARTTPGHHFGSDLSVADRAALVAYLATL